MSKQMTLGTGLEKYGKTTRRENFLTEMDRIVPWGELCALIAPVYPKATERGVTAPLPPRRERAVATMADMGMGDMAGMKGMSGGEGMKGMDGMKGMKGGHETNIANMKMPAAKMKGMDPAQPATDAMPGMPEMKMAAAPVMSGSATTPLRPTGSDRW